MTAIQKYDRALEGQLLELCRDSSVTYVLGVLSKLCQTMARERREMGRDDHVARAWDATAKAAATAANKSLPLAAFGKDTI
jgi:hypothetical protein